MFKKLLPFAVMACLAACTNTQATSDTGMKMPCCEKCECCKSGKCECCKDEQCACCKGMKDSASKDDECPMCAKAEREWKAKQKGATKH